MSENILKELELTEEQKVEGGKLTEAQEQQIMDASEDWGPEGDVKKPEDELEAKDDTLPVKTVEEDSEEELGLTEEEQKVEDERLSKKSDELGKTVDEIRELETKEAEAEQVEQDRIAKLAEDQEKTVEEVVASEKAEADKVETERVEAVAKEEGVSVDDVRENEKKDQAILERHGNEPQKVARALRMLQSESDKLKSENGKYKVAEQQQSRIIGEQEFNRQCEERKEDLINLARKDSGNEELEDEVCFKLGKAKAKTLWDSAKAQEAEEIKTKATDARKEHLDNLDDALKKEFRAEVSEYLDKCSDQQVISSDFDANQIALLCRGKKYSPEHIKTLEKEAFNRGAEEKKILGAKRGPQGSTPPSPVKGKGTVTTSLDDDQKARAESMYGGTNMSKQEMYNEYEKTKDNDF